MEPLTQESIAEEYRGEVATQDYSAKAKIEGVRLIDLRLMQDDGGSFAELARLDEQGNLEAIPEFKVRQTSFSEVLPGAVKAFHLHYKQEDVWFIPPADRLLVGLLDVRQDSSSKGVSVRMVLGAGRTQLLYIPRGVAHGCANISTTSSRVFYFVNQQFSLEQPDEHRLPWDMLGADFWQITNG